LNDFILKGATLWARQTIVSDIFFYKPDKWFKIWFFIVNKVNHTDTKLFKRSTNLITYAEISEFTKATKNQIDMFIRWAKKEQMLTTEKTTRGMIVTVCNYDKFQTLDNYKNDTENELQTKRKRNRNDTINKYDKNDIYEKNDINNSKKPKKEIIIPSLPIRIPNELWQEFKRHRINKKSRLTSYAEKLMIEKLIKYIDQGYDPVELINKTIEAGWQDIKPEWIYKGKSNPLSGIVSEKTQRSIKNIQEWMDDEKQKEIQRMHDDV